MKTKSVAKPSTPAAYIANLEEPRRAEMKALHAMIRAAVPELKPGVGDGMIGYGSYHYRYASGREGDSAIIGLSSRKQYISVYVMGVKGGKYVAETYKKKLPGADIGKCCIRFRRLEDVSLPMLKKAITEGAACFK